jgi:hypothetical protein
MFDWVLFWCVLVVVIVGAIYAIASGGGSDDGNEGKWGVVMFDVLYLLASIVFFVVAQAYARACDDL